MIVGTEGHDLGLDLGNQLRRRKRKIGADKVNETVFAKFVARSVVGFRNAVGIYHQEIAGAESEFLRDAFPSRGHADDGGSGGEVLDGAVGAEEKRRIVATVGVFQVARGVVVDREEERGIAVVGSALKEEPVDGI